MSDQLHPIDYDPSDDEDDDDYFEGEDIFDCGWDGENGCSMAGSEDCDFECPHRDQMMAALKRKTEK